MYDYYYGKCRGFTGISVNILCTEMFRDWGKFYVLQEDDAVDM